MGQINDNGGERRGGCFRSRPQANKEGRTSLFACARPLASTPPQRLLPPPLPPPSPSLCSPGNRWTPGKAAGLTVHIRHLLRGSLTVICKVIDSSGDCNSSPQPSFPPPLPSPPPPLPHMILPVISPSLFFPIASAEAPAPLCSCGSVSGDVADADNCLGLTRKRCRFRRRFHGCEVSRRRHGAEINSPQNRRRKEPQEQPGDGRAAASCRH